MINVTNEDFWKLMVDNTDPPRRRIKRRGNYTRLATDHNNREEIQNTANTTLGRNKKLR
jgi:hypothetical protein